MSSPNRCKVCNHRAIDEINRLLLTDRTANDQAVTLGYIVQRINKAHPDQKITISGLSRHKSGHLLAQPLAVQNEDGQIEFFGTRQLDQRTPPKPDDIQLALSPKEAAEFIIGIGLMDVMSGKLRVSGDMLTKVLIEYLKTYGKDTDDKTDVTKEAWEALHNTRRKVTVTKTASVSETVEQIESPILPVLPIGEVIEGESELLYESKEGPDPTNGNT